jgi:hypothetical protein
MTEEVMPMLMQVEFPETFPDALPETRQEFDLKLSKQRLKAASQPSASMMLSADALCA